ncbi:MAG: DUF1318 domain-containing protein [Verrucomicrobia bacterium]|jgi:uncharacterized protein YdbL (DUF1318 family)|nr:DUF1318 domain-containing protein [Verrucomicrobiota bacterium]
MRRFSLPLLLSFFVLAFAAAIPAGAEDGARKATERMKDRLPVVDSLKENGAVGETSGGYLQARSELLPRQKAVVEAENRDRRLVYRRIAERTNQSVREVGEQRALRIAEQAAPGVWLQRPSGEWFRKGGGP